MTDPRDLERAERDAEAEAEAVADAVADAAADAADDAADDEALVDNHEDDVPTANEYSVAFTPRNVAVGLAIVAGLVAVVAARRRKRPGEAD
jgi:hypothetical protein